ncbi:hypothetical protein RAA17_15575 [Komagataeibacter rhaeticus]|nr:hypothetical protein [Komagataeibacter rhaeticus]
MRPARQRGQAQKGRTDQARACPRLPARPAEDVLFIMVFSPLRDAAWSPDAFL